MLENLIIKHLNADAQEPAPSADQAEDATTATTNTPADTPTEELANTTLEEPKNNKPAPPVQTAHDDFDWTIDKRNITAYSDEEKEKYNNVNEKTFVDRKRT